MQIILFFIFVLSSFFNHISHTTQNPDQSTLIHIGPYWSILVHIAPHCSTLLQNTAPKQCCKPKNGAIFGFFMGQSNVHQCFCRTSAVHSLPVVVLAPSSKKPTECCACNHGLSNIHCQQSDNIRDIGTCNTHTAMYCSLQKLALDTKKSPRAAAIYATDDVAYPLPHTAHTHTH